MLTDEFLQKYHELMEEERNSLETVNQADDNFTMLEPFYLVPTEVLINLKTPANHALKSYNAKQLALQARIIKASAMEAQRKEESKQTASKYSGKRLKKSIFK